LSYRGLASSSGRGRFPSLLHKRGIVFQQTSKCCVPLLHSSALWKQFCSGRHTMFDFSAFTYRFYSQTVPVLTFFNVPDIVMRRRSICRRRTKSIVVFAFVFKTLIHMHSNNFMEFLNYPPLVLHSSSYTPLLLVLSLSNSAANLYADANKIFCSLEIQWDGKTH